MVNEADSEVTDVNRVRGLDPKKHDLKDCEKALDILLEEVLGYRFKKYGKPLSHVRLVDLHEGVHELFRREPKEAVFVTFSNNINEWQMNACLGFIGAGINKHDIVTTGYTDSKYLRFGVANIEALMTAINKLAEIQSKPGHKNEIFDKIEEAIKSPELEV